MSVTKTHSASLMANEEWVSQIQQQRCVVRLINHETIEVEYPSQEIFANIEEWLWKEHIMNNEY
jgi:hypothetical protein